MLRRKFFSQRFVKQSGPMNTADPIASSSNRIASLKCCNQIVKKMPDYSASKHLEDIKQVTLECEEKQRFGEISGNDVILCDGTIVKNASYNPTRCQLTNCKTSTTQTIVYTKDMSIRTASEQIAYNKARLRTINKPINMPNLRVHTC